MTADRHLFNVAGLVAYCMAYLGEVKVSVLESLIKLKLYDSMEQISCVKLKLTTGFPLLPFFSSRNYEFVKIDFLILLH